jgi:hypothetical protein
MPQNLNHFTDSITFERNSQLAYALLYEQATL